MGNQPSLDDNSFDSGIHAPPAEKKEKDDKEKYKSFPGSAILEKTFCGSIDTTDPSEYEDVNLANRLLKKADIMCVSSPDDEKPGGRIFLDDGDTDNPKRKTSAMLARALVSEVTDNPKTMKQAEMAAREYQLLKAQQAAASRRAQPPTDGSQPVGAPGGVGPPNVLTSLAFAVTGDETAGNVCVHPKDAGNIMGPGLDGSRGAPFEDDEVEYTSPYAVTIGLSLSRRHSTVGHPETVTRQTAFDFNELQDRNYKYVSSTDPSGWRAGGGERGGSSGASDEFDANGQPQTPSSQKASSANADKIAAPDVVHIPIIHINCESDEQVEQIIHALASGEIFIPHMAILPEALSVNGISPPDLVVRFGCERSEDTPPDEWPNWCLEFMHNQLYEYFYSMGARWMKRPFSITLARKVKWKTVKHMNKYFAHAEQVIESWRDKGPQMLNPQLSYVEGGATPEEVAHPHGIYLMRKGVPTNYFAPNFDPPYTTKMTRSLLENVMNKSWDKKRQEWTSEPIPKLVTPNLLMAMACGCTDPSTEGFMAREVTAASIRKTVQGVTDSGNQQMLSAADQQYYETQHRMLEEADKGSDGGSSDGSQSQKQNQAFGSDDRYETAEDPKVETVTSEDDSRVEEVATTNEEKKTEDFSEQDGRQESAKKAAWRSSSGISEAAAQSEAPSGTTGMTATTVMHANMMNKGQRNTTSSEDDWAQPVKPETRANDEKPTLTARWSKKKAEGKTSSTRHKLDGERKRQQELLKKVDSTTPKKDGKKSSYTMSPVTPASPNKREVEQSESGASMEYSQDGSSTFMTEGGSTLMGQHFAGDETVTSNRLLKKKSTNSEEEDSAMLNIQASSSTLSVVPTDEELFAIGWAKALDPSSGNYYYYTLDRKTTIWENPLSSNQSSEGSKSSIDP